MDAIKPYSQIAEPAFLAWVISIILVGLLLRFGREMIGALLMKLYEVFIQQNPASL